MTDGSFHLREIPVDATSSRACRQLSRRGLPAVKSVSWKEMLDVNPTYAVAEGQDVGYLLGGDVTGYVDGNAGLITK